MFSAGVRTADVVRVSSPRSRNPFDEESEAEGHSGLDETADRRPSLVAGLSYNATHFAEKWLYAAIVCHLVQFSILLSKAAPELSPGLLFVLSLLVVVIPGLLVYGRLLVVKKKLRREDGFCAFSRPASPEEETDAVPDRAIYLVSAAAVLEGVLLAVFAVAVGAAGGGPSSADRNTIVEALQFASITLLCFHRVLRPANRVDPMRTVMELEVVR